EQKARQEFKVRNQENMLAWRDAILAYALFYPAVEFLSFATIALIYWSGGNRILGHALSLGVLIEFTMFAQRFFRPIQDLSEKFNILQSAMAASERIFKLLDEPITIDTNPNAQAIAKPRGEDHADLPAAALLRYSARPDSAGWHRHPPAQSAGIAQTVRHRAAGPIPLQRHNRIECAVGHAGNCAGKCGARVEGNRAWRVHAVIAARRGHRCERARVHAILWPAAIDQLCAGAGAQSALPDPGRSHLQRGHENRIADSRSTEPAAHRAHRTGHRPPLEHDSGCGPHPRLPQRPPARAGGASGT